MALSIGIAPVAGPEGLAWFGVFFSLAWALIVASAFATRSSKVLPHAALASAFNSPVSATLPVEAEGPINARASPSETLRMDAVACERELPLMSFIRSEEHTS